jgi:hypothetical protein
MFVFDEENGHSPINVDNVIAITKGTILDSIKDGTDRHTINFKCVSKFTFSWHFEKESTRNIVYSRILSQLPTS